jgi:predicted nucleotidyltransferase
MLQISPTLTELQEIASQLPEQIPYLKMLILFGSRARGDTHPKSDWDFAALYDMELREESCKDRGFAWFEVPVILGEAFRLNSDEIDVVELNRCSPLIDHFIARDGILIYEKEPGEFEKFTETHLMSDAELKETERELRQKINNFLEEWGVV